MSYIIDVVASFGSQSQYGPGLVPATTDVTDKDVKFLNAKGEWVAPEKSTWNYVD